MRGEEGSELQVPQQVFVVESGLNSGIPHWS
jgi:hypothetical protein